MLYEVITNAGDNNAGAIPGRNDQAVFFNVGQKIGGQHGLV